MLKVNSQGIFHPFDRAINFVKRNLPGNAARIKALNTSRTQNDASIKGMLERLEIERTSPALRENYHFTLDRTRALLSAQLDIISQLRSLGAATGQEVVACQTAIKSLNRVDSLAGRLEENQTLYAAMEKRLQNQNADNPAESTEHLFTLNRIEALLGARLEMLQASNSSASNLAACREQIAAINQQRTLVYGKIKQQLGSDPKAIDTLERELTRNHVNYDRQLYLLREIRARLFDRFRLADTLATQDDSFADRATAEMKTAINAATPFHSMAEGLAHPAKPVRASVSAVQQHQLSIVTVMPQEASVPLAEAA